MNGKTREAQSTPHRQGGEGKRPPEEAKQLLEGSARLQTNLWLKMQPSYATVHLGILQKACFGFCCLCFHLVSFLFGRRHRHRAHALLLPPPLPRRRRRWLRRLSRATLLSLGVPRIWRGTLGDQHSWTGAVDQRENQSDGLRIPSSPIAVESWPGSKDGRKFKGLAWLFMGVPYSKSLLYDDARGPKTRGESQGAGKRACPPPPPELERK